MLFSMPESGGHRIGSKSWIIVQNPLENDTRSTLTSQPFFFRETLPLIITKVSDLVEWLSFKSNTSGGILTKVVDKALEDKTEVDARESGEDDECKGWGTGITEIPADTTSANQEEDTTTLPAV